MKWSGGEGGLIESEGYEIKRGEGGRKGLLYLELGFNTSLN